MKILYLSRNYPNQASPYVGLWVEGLVRAMSEIAEVRVIAPVPYVPPLLSLPQSRLRDVPRTRLQNGVEVHAPRYLLGPGYTTHDFEGLCYHLGVRGAVDRLRESFPFDLIHAQFVYPDGAAAAQLARRYGVPLVITDHAPWLPWMRDYPNVRRQALEAADAAAFHFAVGASQRQTIVDVAGDSEKLRVVPIGVDADLFTPADRDIKKNGDRIIYVGRLHHTKGTDILLRAMRRIVDRQPSIRLTIVGGNLGFENYKRHEAVMRELAETLNLGPHIDFAGELPPAQVAQRIRKSDALVLPSRRETFGAVLLEALACGVPVVATRCGGPQDFIDDSVGRTVPIEDPEALAASIEDVLANRAQFDPAALRAHALKYSWRSVAAQTHAYYAEALRTGAPARETSAPR